MSLLHYRILALCFVGFRLLYYRYSLNIERKNIHNEKNNRTDDNTNRIGVKNTHNNAYLKGPLINAYHTNIEINRLIQYFIIVFCCFFFLRYLLSLLYFHSFAFCPSSIYWYFAVMLLLLHFAVHFSTVDIFTTRYVLE